MKKSRCERFLNWKFDLPNEAISVAISLVRQTNFQSKRFTTRRAVRLLAASCVARALQIAADMLGACNSAIHPKFAVARVVLISRQLLILAALFLAVGLCHAEPQFPVGTIIRGFDLPQTNKEGKISSRIRGAEAMIMSANQILVRKLEIEVYENNSSEPTTRILSPECFYWRMENKLTTDHNIEVHHPGMTITAKAMEWNVKQSRGTFRQNVKVVIQSGADQKK